MSKYSLLCPLLLFVNTDDTVSTDMCLTCKEHSLMNQVLSEYFPEQNISNTY
jgi:hypothetical protein